MTTWMTMTLFATVLLYVIAASWQLRLLMTGNGEMMMNIFTLSAIACGLHSVVLYHTITHHVLLGAMTLVEVMNLIVVVVTALVLLASPRRPLTNLLIFVLPLGALGLLLMLGLEPVPLASMPYTPAQIAHIALSILAFSLLGAAALQAILLAVGEYFLKAKHVHRRASGLAPLETMESCLFQLIVAGFIMLTAVFVSSYLFFDGIWSGELFEKTLLTAIAWTIFLVLVLGRLYYGWRGRLAINGTLLGLFILILSYFGTRLYQTLV